MSDRSSIVTVQAVKLRAAELARVEAASIGGNPTPIDELSDGFAGNYAFRAFFPTPADAIRYEAEMREHGCLAWRRLDPSAVKSWIGKYASVHVAALYSGGMLSKGLVQEEGAERIRIVPEGRDPAEGDVFLIWDVVDIEPLATYADASINGGGSAPEP